MKDLKVVALMCLCILSLSACNGYNLGEQEITSYEPNNEIFTGEIPTAKPTDPPVPAKSTTTTEAPKENLATAVNSWWGLFERQQSMTIELPKSGNDLTDFIPQGWTLLDSAEIDYNGDGYPDFIGVIWKDSEYVQNGQNVWYPRIVFAIAQQNDEPRYLLEFQDVNDFRSHDYSTAYGNPFISLTGYGNSFTTYAAGSGSCRCTENNTYRYVNGEWFKGESFNGFKMSMYKYMDGKWVFLKEEHTFPYIPPKMGIVPQLPESGSDITDFVPETWILLDSVELDYNGDGYADFVGVLERPWGDGITWYPRILFSISSENDGNGYKLEFQDINALRSSDEGGAYGDPYNELSTEGNTFTTHAYGGSSWRWSEDITYKYEDGEWLVKTAEYNNYRFSDEPYAYRLDNYETGIGKRMESNGNDEPPRYEVTYEVPLDPPPTLQEFNMNIVFSSERLKTLEVNDMTVLEGIDYNPIEVPPPSDDFTISSIKFINVDYILYTFKNAQETREYLAVYDQHSKDATVIAAEDYFDYLNRLVGGFDYNIYVYKDKIFYTRDVFQLFNVKQYDGSIIKTNLCVATQLCSMDLDGSDNRLVFEYKNEFEEKDILDDFLPHISLAYEITGDQIIVQVYDGSKEDPFYRLNLDGSIIEHINSLPEEQIDYN